LILIIFVIFVENFYIADSKSIAKVVSSFVLTDKQLKGINGNLLDDGQKKKNSKFIGNALLEFHYKNKYYTNFILQKKKKFFFFLSLCVLIINN
jgi:hypothetical protein